MSVTRTCKEWPLAYETEHKTFATMKKNTSQRINVKNNQGLYESTYPVANMTIVSDRPIQQGLKYRGTITVDDIDNGDCTFRTEATIHHECPERRYYALHETKNGSLKINAKRVRCVLEMPYAATDTGTDIAEIFSPQLKQLLAKLRKTGDYLSDVYACQVIGAQADARAEAKRERESRALHGIEE